ncbi:NADPH-dependent F420 reductase [Deinococcus planocerae]|uniref:NADPH-dependent F420 reductase n=1 Tax=Deinococcus planocerae TaxID=1737569 RepID=UPI000C7F2ACC|nr:NAD(P)-binding domain-containing protein [Deinococcus planocerae]
MKIGILGSGVVGQVIGQKVAELGHDVMIGTRDPANLGEPRGWAPSLGAWLADTNGRGRVGTFAQAAAYGELLVNATNGLASLDALRQAGAQPLGNKVMLDLANELDVSRGMPPRSLATDDRSLAEEIQAAFPDVRVVKSLNTMNANVMVDPRALAGGDHTVFLSGNDAEAKAQVAELLRAFGWTDIFDLGDLGSARGVEMLLPLWLRVWGGLGNVPFNFKIVR